MNNLEVLELTMKLQSELDKMTNKEFTKFMKNKALRHEGKLYTIAGDKNETKRNKSKSDGQTKRTNKKSNRNAEDIRANEN